MASRSASSLSDVAYAPPRPLEQAISQLRRFLLGLTTNPDQMPKIISRGAISQSKEDGEDTNKGLSIYYCLCGEFLLVLEGRLSSLPRRPSDNSYVLRNKAREEAPLAKKKVYKLNAIGGTGLEAGGILMRRDKSFEFQRRLHCSRCALAIGYETTPGEGTKGEATFILAGSMTETQNEVPKDAFGPLESEGKETGEEASGDKQDDSTTAQQSA